MKNTAAVILLSVLLIGFMCSCGSSSSGAAENSATLNTTESSFVEYGSITESNFGDSEMYHEMALIIKDAFSDYSPTISYDKENALVNITVIAADGTSAALETDQNAITASWESITENLSALSLSGYELLSEAGLTIGCSVMLLNDQNTDNALFAALNGEEVYNAFKN